MDYVFAKQKADELKALLSPSCERIEDAGSIRREKPDGIHDIELVCISKRPRAEFGNAASGQPQLLALLDQMRADDVLDHRRDKNGRPAWGRRFKRALWGEIPVDIFITDYDRWGMIYTIRTGCAEFAHALVTPRHAGGLLPDRHYVEDGHLHQSDGTIVPTPEEIDVFTATGIGWIEPRLRTENAIGAIRAAWRIT